ncbi:MAG: acyl-CoA thioesterase [Myxococcales bacterium]|nr:acyl-CoA thioesterase [Myxococcales bacterium]
MSFVFRRPVRFDEIDAAGYVYFPKIVALGHEAMERMIGEACPGGYAAWVVERRVGLPCVHVESDFRAPLRFGDELVVESTVAKLGDSSVRFDVKVGRGDGVACATIGYVVACADLAGPSKRSLPDDLRAALARYA